MICINADICIILLKMNTKILDVVSKRLKENEIIIDIISVNNIAKSDKK